MKKLIAIGLAAVLALALVTLPVIASIPPYTIDLEPYMDGNLVGEDHTVTATVLDVEENPEEDVLVTFMIAEGPNYDGSLHTDYTDANGQASWTYTGTMGCGLDVIVAWVNYDDDPLYEGEPSDWAGKYWLLDKFSGGGKIIQENGGRKTWPKITWGGWAGTTCGDVDGFTVTNLNGDYYPVGEFEVTFHNVGNDYDYLDKAKFVSWGVIRLEYRDFSTEGCPGADPPPSYANFAQVRLLGEIQYADDSIEYGMLVINGMDNGEPGNIDDEAGEVTSDGIRFILYSGGDRIYDSYWDFDDDQDNPCGDDGVRHELDSGNLQIVVPVDAQG